MSHRYRLGRIKSFIFFQFGIPSLALACDPCALYTAAGLHGFQKNATTISISEQLTSFDKAEGTPESIHDGELVREFSTTQLGVAHDFSEKFGGQITVPFIGRRFDKIEGFRVNTENDFEIGDVALLGSAAVINEGTEKWTFRVTGTAGIKFPTGDTGVLREVEEEEEEEAAHDHESGDTHEGDHQETEHHLRHHQVGGASGGRALAFGTGSYDYITGLSIFTRYEKYLLFTTAQYTIRTEGDFDYEFADDFVGSIGPGYYVWIDHDYTAAIRTVLTGEFKASDHQHGEVVSGSKLSNLYLGPDFLLTYGTSIGFEIAAEGRVSGEDDSETVNPVYRLRAAVSYRF